MKQIKLRERERKKEMREKGSTVLCHFNVSLRPSELIINLFLSISYPLFLFTIFSRKLFNILKKL
jgi:hypothetical protein